MTTGVEWAIIGSSLLSAGGSAVAADKQKGEANKANKKSKLSRIEALNLIQQRVNTPVDFGEFVLPKDLNFDIETLGEEVLDSAAVADLERAFSLLPRVEEFSRAQGKAAAGSVSEALDAFSPGSSERRKKTLEGLNSFLNFELPQGARREIDRRAAETGLRTGNFGGPVATDYADRVRYDTITDNFFRATQAGQQEQQINLGALGGAGQFQQAFIPGGGSTFALANQNLNLRNQAGLTNYQRQLSEAVSNQNLQVSQRIGSLERADRFAQIQAGISANQANASQQQANSLAQASAQNFGSAFSALGQGVGQLVSSRYYGQQLQQQQQAGYQQNYMTDSVNAATVPGYQRLFNQNPF